MKRKLLTLAAGLFLINLASAYYGSYSSFSLSDMLNSIDSSTMILGAVFVLAFLFVNWSLLKFFKDNKTFAGIGAFVISLLIVYGLNKTNFDIEGLFYNFGISGDMLYVILPLILLAGIIYLFIKLKTKALFILGGIFILLSFTELIYEKGLSLIIGIALLLIGLWLWWRKKKPKNPPLVINPQSTSNPIPTSAPRPPPVTPKSRTQKELQKKYDDYSDKIKQIMKKNKGKIPALNTSEGHKYHRYIQAMRAIENLARAQRITLR